MGAATSNFGSHLIVGLDGPVLLSSEAKLLRNLQPAGIIIFAKNIAPGIEDSWSEHLKRLISDCQTEANRQEFLVSIDHEGGRVHRLPPPVTRFPSAWHWGSDSRSVGQAMGIELRALGFSLSFAPVLDMRSEAANKVINDRAFGSNPKQTATAAIEFFSGLQSAGVLGCGKHFPGHGGTIADSHYELPTLASSREEIYQRELLPFVEFLKAKPSLMMTAHVMYPALDSKYPATLSKTIINGILRQELGYNGAVITDDLEMAALSHLTPAQKASHALTAGVDLLLEGNTTGDKTGALPLERAKQMATGLAQAVASGELSNKVVAESQQRIAELFSNITKLQAKANSPKSTADALGNPRHCTLEKTLRQRILNN